MKWPYMTRVLLAATFYWGMTSAAHLAASTDGTSASTTNPAQNPLLIKTTGTLKDLRGEPRTGLLGVTFTLFENQYGGNPLWIETQNVALDELGRFEINLGGATPNGVPPEIFQTGRPIWLATQALVPDSDEAPRVQLVSVPFAINALNADTLGGKPLSAFLLAEEHANNLRNSEVNAPPVAAAGPPKEAIVSYPTATQTIEAPSDPGVVPLRIKGNGSSNSLELFSSPNGFSPQSYFDAQGGFVSTRAPRFSTFANGSILFSGANGLLSEDRTNLVWDSTSRGLRIGPPKSAFLDGTITYRYDASINHFLAKDSGKDFVLQVGNQDGGNRHSVVQMVTQEDTHAIGTRGSVLASAAQAIHSGSGNTAFLIASTSYIEQIGTGAVSNLIAHSPYISFGGYEPTSTAGSVTNMEMIQTGGDVSGVNNVENVIGVHIGSPTKSGSGIVTSNIGLKIDNQSIGATNMAIQTGTGKVQFGDTVQAIKSIYSGLVAFSGSGDVAIDASKGNSFKFTMTGNAVSRTITGGNVGQLLVLFICQDTLGDRSFQWPSNVRLSNGAFSLTKAPRKCDSWTGIFDGIVWLESSRATNIEAP